MSSAREPRALAALLDKKKAAGADTRERLQAEEENARKKAFPLTAVQQNFYDIQQRSPQSLMWVLPVLYAFPSADEKRLVKAAQTMVKTHPIFCTVLSEDGTGRITQAYRPELLPPIRVETASEEEIAQIRATLKDPDLPFRMTGNRLAKVRLLRTEKNVYLYLLIHHVLTDGTGIQAMPNTLKAAFRGEAPDPDCYYSWLEEESEKSRTPEYDRSREVMEKLYQGVDWIGQLPTNGRVGGAENTVLGAFIPMTEEELQSREQETGLSRTGLCALAIMLSLAKQTQRRDILINWVFSNRGDARLNAISCMVLRSLTLGLRFDRMETLADACREVREQMLSNIACSAYEWCLHHPPQNGNDRLFFVYEGAITGFDILRDIGGKMIPMLMSNQAVVHPMSAQVLAWQKDGQPGLLLACYCNKNLYDAAETDRFKAIMREAALLMLKTPDIMERSVKGMLTA